MSELIDRSRGAEDTYWVWAECINCDWRGRLKLPYGELAPRNHRGALCEICGTEGVTKRPRT